MAHYSEFVIYYYIVWKITLNSSFIIILYGRLILIRHFLLYSMEDNSYFVISYYIVWKITLNSSFINSIEDYS